jgi:lipid A 3-O-deacylase
MMDKQTVLARAALVLPVVAALLPAPALAQDVFAGVLAHDVHLPLDLSGQEDGLELEVGYRSGRMVGLGFLGGPSFYVRGALAASGGTDFVSAGLSWRLGNGRFYVQPALGLAVQTGRMPVFDASGRRTDLGSRIVFEPEAAIGYRIAPRLSVEATLVHRSHAGLFNSRQNPGMDSLGLRLNFRL